MLALLLLAAVPDSNLLSLEAGTVIVQAPASWGGTWTPEALADGDPATGWCNAVGTRAPYAFVYELEQRSMLGALEVNNSNTEESSNPGCSANGIEVWVSSSGPNEGFTKVTSVALKKGGSLRAVLPKETMARWVKLIIPGNFGDPRYTELMEVSLTGHALEPSPQKNLSGTWRLDGGGTLRLSGDGASLTGCALFPNEVWTVKGMGHGRAATLNWVHEAAGGSATIAIADDGTLKGRWRGDVSGSGSWAGTKRAEAELDCRTALEDQRFARRLNAETLGVTLTGVTFDVGTDELRLEARNELLALERLLTANPSLRARLLVLGRSSEAAPDELKRCERRAQKLLTHLQRAGVPASAVDVGIGILKVGAAVQLEPRVEALMLH
jgi:outer membrane protein OmpA-like peptidoglycan-associated protein